MLGAHPTAMRALGGSVGDLDRFTGGATRGGAGDLAGPPARNLPPLGKQQAFVNTTPAATSSLAAGVGGAVVQGGRINQYLAPIAAYSGGGSGGAHDNGPMSADAATGGAYFKDDPAAAAAVALKGGGKGGLASLRHRSLAGGLIGAGVGAGATIGNGSGHGSSGPEDSASAAPPKPPVAGKDAKDASSGLSSKRSKSRRFKAASTSDK